MDAVLPEAPVVPERGRLTVAAFRFLSCLPALALALLAIRLFEVPAATGGSADLLALGASSLAADALLLARALPFLYLLSLPFLLPASARLRFVGLGVLWSLLVFVEIGLTQYFLSARVPLGADLFAYTWDEVRSTAAAGAQTDLRALTAMAAPLLVLWFALAWLTWRFRVGREAPIAILLFISVAAWLLPSQPVSRRTSDEDSYNLVLNKTEFFIADSVRYLIGPNEHGGAAIAVAAAPVRAASTAHSSNSPDPRYPFLHAERTPDVLGPHFHPIRSGRPPNLVFIVVEGLGRTFSGPEARLGSFTPFLDELAGRSLYFSNFLAPQGRTFGVLPSLLGSTPFGERGFNALRERMPAHDDVLSVLGTQGYRLAYYTGTDAEFDNQAGYLRQQGVKTLIEDNNFGPGYTTSHVAGATGYADGELFARAVHDLRNPSPQPFVAVVQTISMHVSFKVPGATRLLQRFEQRLDELGIPEADKARYRQFRDIYVSVLYTDEAMQQFFTAVQGSPDYADTIFIVTGDHRLPELPMEDRIERYHVPMLIFSPLLKSPERIRSVSSQFDIAPSVLAYLADDYGLRRPAMVTWVGDGLDLTPRFRNGHDIPLKQTKTSLTDFISGSWYMSRGELYSVTDGMRIEPAADTAVAAQVQQRFALFRDANAQFAQNPVLKPSAATMLIAYDAAQVDAPIKVVDDGIAVSDVRSHEVGRGVIELEATFVNGSAATTGPFVPLAVLADAEGREVAEGYGAALRLGPGATGRASIRVTAADLPPGQYFLAVIPSHPDSGRKIGAGRYRIAVRLGG